MQAILYAAGIGMRLKSSFGERPKILLEFGGQSLLERHLHRLREVGVTRLTVVAGYQQQQIAALLPPLSARYGIAIQQLINPDFTEGSVLSFATSIPVLHTIEAGDRVLLMDGDVLYPAEFLRRLVDSPHRTALLIDREYSTADDDPVLVPIANSRPFDFVKKWQGHAEQIGESIGFFKVAGADLPELITLTKQFSATNRTASYDDVLRRLVQAGRFGCEDVTGLPWTEIDFPQDVERAHAEVLPAIENLSAPEAMPDSPSAAAVPTTAKPVERLFPFVLKARALIVGRDTLERSKSRLHFILITTDISQNSRAQILKDYAHYPIVQHYTEADLEKYFGLKSTKLIGFAKSGLAQSIYAELKPYRINQPVPKGKLDSD